MPFVTGFLRARKRWRPGRPDIGLPDPEHPVDPDYGIEEGELPEVEPPDPPHGIWPPLTPEHPWRPLPSLPERPSTGPVPGLPPAQPGHPIPPAPGQPLPPGEPGEPVQPLPPGMIWPPLPPGVSGHFLALVLIGGAGHGVHYRYVVVDASLRPEHPMVPPPVAQPKR